MGAQRYQAIYYFDAHRLQPDLLDTLNRQIDPGLSKLASPDGAGEEAASTNDESDPEDPTDT